MYRTHTQLTTSGAGPDGFQSLVSIITMMQDCSLAWLASEPAMAAYLEREHVAMLLASRQLEVCRRAHLGEELTVATSIFAFNRLLGHRNTCIYDADGALVAKSRCVGVFVSRDTGKTVRLPQEVVDSLVYDPEIPVDVSAKKIHVPDVAPDRVEHVRARFSDIDFNRHVNNAQYVRMAVDANPALADTRHMGIEYRLAAHEGDEIAVQEWDTDDATIVRLANRDEKPYVVMSFQR